MHDPSVLHALARAAGVSGVKGQLRRYGVVDARVWLTDAEQPLQAPVLSAKSVYPALRGILLFKPEPFSVLPAAASRAADDLATGADELLGGFIEVPRLPEPLRPPADPLRAGIKAVREVAGVRRAAALGKDDLLAVELDLEATTTLAQLQSAALAAGVMLRPASLAPVAGADAARPAPFWLGSNLELADPLGPPAP